MRLTESAKHGPEVSFLQILLGRAKMGARHCRAPDQRLIKDNLPDNKERVLEVLGHTIEYLIDSRPFLPAEMRGRDHKAALDILKIAAL